MRQLTVLLVEDNPRDVRLTQRAFKQAGLDHDLRVVGDGDEALAYLHREGAYKEAETAPRPDVILLDLNLPRMGGHELLREVKQDNRFRQVPIIVLTTSERPDDVRLAYDAGANAYLLKPVEFNRFTEVIGQLGKFWLETVELPPEGEPTASSYRRTLAMAVPSYRLLVVDDSKRDTLLLERILQQASDATFTVTHMESAKAGLEELSAQTYDLVLLDYYLPDMDGLAFLEEKQKRGLTAPVIMLTAFAQERLPVAALQAGALDYFRKDQVNSSLLGKAIQQAIEKARLQARRAADAARLRELEETVARLQQQLKAQQQS